MTAPAHPVDRAQRVSDAVVENNCQRVRAIASAGFELTSDERSWLDLEDTRALLAERDAEIARLRTGLQDAKDEAEANAEMASEAEHWSRLAFVDIGANPAITWKERALKAEAALATATRDGWIACRDAAIAAVRNPLLLTPPSAAQAKASVFGALRALTPPAEEEGERHE